MSNRSRSLKSLALDSTDIKKGDIFKVNPKLIQEEDGFNLRNYNDPDVREHIEAFADSYEQGRFVPPLLVRVDDDGKILVVEGHCRRRGALLAIERGLENLYVQCIQFRGSDTDRIQVMLSSAEGLNFKPLEVAQGYLRLSRMGLSNTEIAKLVSKSSAHVEQMLLLATSNYDVQKLVSNGSVSATLAISTVRKKGEGAGKFLQKYVDEAKENGKKSVTRKSVTPWTPPKKVLINMYEVIKNISALHNLKTDLLALSREELQEKTVLVPADAILKLLELQEEINSNRRDKEVVSGEAVNLDGSSTSEEKEVVSGEAVNLDGSSTSEEKEVVSGEAVNLNGSSTSEEVVVIADQHEEINLDDFGTSEDLRRLWRNYK
jgi:ParB family transcriptional regulator, chromosome partitioning protein